MAGLVQAELDWAGLGWAELDYAGLGSAPLGWAELARLPRLGWLGRNGWDRLGGPGLAWAGLGELG